jgi:NTE family protein
MRIVAIIMAGLAASACAGAPNTTPINVELTGAPVAAPSELGVDGDALALALSGGGARAASFSLGALMALRDMKDAGGKPLIDRVALVTAVSGGSITAAYFGQNGVAGLDTFRAAVLDKDWQKQIHTSFVSPNNWARLLQGGLNGPDKLADWLDREVFKGGKIGDLPSRPRIVINATDLYSGTPFAFSPAYYQAICSDLGATRIADAVAASMAVPIAFRPIVVKTFTENCPSPLPAWVDAAKNDRSAPVLLRETAKAFERYRDPATMQYLHLSDGGVADNFGLSSLITIRHASQTPYGPFSARDAVKVKRMTFLVINAELSASGAWAKTAAGPDGPAMLDASLSAAVNAPKRAAADAFRSTLADWEHDLVTYRCGLSTDEATALGAGPGWDCKDVHFKMDMVSFADLSPAQLKELGSAPTQVSLPKETIDHLIAGGRQAIETNAAVREMTR